MEAIRSGWSMLLSRRQAVVLGAGAVLGLLSGCSSRDPQAILNVGNLVDFREEPVADIWGSVVYESSEETGYWLMTDADAGTTHVLIRTSAASGGYGISVDRASDEDGTLVIHGTVTEPEGGYAYLTVISYPECAIVVDGVYEEAEVTLDYEGADGTPDAVALEKRGVLERPRD